MLRTLFRYELIATDVAEFLIGIVQIVVDAELLHEEMSNLRSQKVQEVDEVQRGLLVCAEDDVILHGRLVAIKEPFARFVGVLAHRLVLVHAQQI